MSSVLKQKVKINNHKHDAKIEATPEPIAEPSMATNVSNNNIIKLNLIEKLFKYANVLFGILLMCMIAYYYSKYIKLLHENYLWFSNIKEVEREISFRTESGLYYSFYKELVLSENLLDGIQSLIYNNKTESWHTINILERFNIYQELILAVLYKLLVNFKSYAFIYFYIDSVFFLHGVYIAVLFCLSWLMSKSIFSSILAVIFYVVHRQHVTRVDYSIPLRESFALPFLYLQVLLICIYLKPKADYISKKFLMQLIFATTFIYCLFWQFSPFILFLQSFTVFSLYIIAIIDSKDAINLLFLNGSALLFSCFMQFLNKMILASFSLHFIYVAIFIIKFEERYKLRFKLNKCLALLYMVVLVFYALSCTLLISFSVKALFNIQSDNHIYKFFMSKIGSEKYQDDFETRLYLCHGGFEYLQSQALYDMIKTGLLPFYLVGQTVYLLAISYFGLKFIFLKEAIKKRFQEPELAFFIIQTLLFGLLALSTTRMKYLWVPSVCVLSSIFVNHNYIFEKFFKNKFDIKIDFAKSLISILIIMMLYNQHWKNIKTELEELREFYDPDTVQLMNWISKHTDVNASFSGSMQLMAGVKCSTGRSITNHPHFENRELRDATKNLYQMYALRKPDEVYAILRHFKTDYIILEDSICLTYKKNMCGLVQLLDIDNDHIDSNEYENVKYRTDVKRFCDEIRYDKQSFTNYFRLVLQNPTFRVYKLA